MKIEHIALWVNDLERMKEFYCNYFNGVANQKYVNPVKGFSSYFIQFDDGCQARTKNAPLLVKLETNSPT